MESDGGNTLLGQNTNEPATRLITRTQNSTLQTLKRNYAKGKTRLWDGKLYPKKNFFGFFHGRWDERQKNTQIKRVDGKPDGKPVSEYHLMGT